MSKEEILRKHYTDFDIESGWIFDGPVQDVFKAMEEYAKQRSIEFAAFSVDWFEHNGMVEPHKRWRSVKNGETFTTEKLYQLFEIQSQKIIPPNE